MKFSATIPAPDFVGAIRTVQKAMKPRNKIPVLNTIFMHIDHDNQEITLMGTDLDVRISTKVPAKVQKARPSNAFALFEPKPVIEFLRGEKGDVEVGHNVEGGVIFTANNTMYSNRIADPVADWPAWDGPFNPRTRKVPTDELHQALRHTLPFISTDETRYYLNGVYMHSHDGKLRAVSTNGHCAAIYDTTQKWSYGPVIMHVKAAKIIADIAKKATGESAAVWVTRDQSKFVIGDTTIWCKNIDGTYPDYFRIIPDIPENPPIYAPVSMARIAGFPKDNKAVMVGIKFDPEMGVATAIVKHNQYSTILSPGARGPAFGLGARYVQAFGKLYPEFELKGTDPKDPLVATPDPKFMWLVMPRLI